MASQDHHHHDGHYHHHHHAHEEGSAAAAAAASWVGPDGRVYHSHDGLAPHSHEPIYSPGFFSKRAQPLSDRNFKERAFTVGIGGPVGTGYSPPKTALMLALCQFLRDKYSLAAVRIMFEKCSFEVFFSLLPIYLQVKHGVGVEGIVNHVLQAWAAATGNHCR
ncbi:hypothetical protein BHE74_00047725 [Ensete ventricosum]|nr:hypothetical protein BHE74_00047725 [Ensete ventricosum]RZS12348.1 hypothetical protein BHM03_00043834 [Ensete ventricosum]